MHMVLLDFGGKTIKGQQARIRKWLTPTRVKAQDEGATNGTWTVGQGVTVHRYSDAEVCTVVRVTLATVTLQRDKATLLNGPKSGADDALVVTPGGFAAHTSGVQRYSYEPDSDGVTTVAHLNQHGEWHTNGTNGRVTAGRREHYDYNF
jgi:hypothetical protein